MQGDGSDYARITVNGNRMERCYGGWYDPEKLHWEPLPREVPYCDLPERETFDEPTGPYGPHLYELLPWRKDGDDWIVEYRGLTLRVRSQWYEDRCGALYQRWNVLQSWKSYRSAWREAVEDADWLLFSRPRLRGLPFEARGVRTRELMREFETAQRTCGVSEWN